MEFSSFLSDIMATVVGGVVLTLLFFWLREKIFPVPDINGKWHLEMLTINTAYNPYKDMVLRYVLMLWREGNSIKGTVEKTYENSSTGERKYTGIDRTRGNVEGFFQKSYLGRDKIFLHIVEHGNGREYTTYCEFIVNPTGNLVGAFSSMAAEQDGIVKCQRENF